MTERRQPTLAGYDDAQVVARFARLSAADGAEASVFDRWVTAATDVLDLGVGAGRTTVLLAPRARRYAGLELSAPMLDAARERCIAKRVEAQLLRGDVTQLPFDGSSFDVVLGPFNTLDYLATPQLRDRSLGEVHRVLRPGGVFAFSSHHPLALPRWRRKEAGPRGLLLAARRYGRELRRVARRAPLIANGEGWYDDEADGGQRLYAGRPGHVVAQLRRHGFGLIEMSRQDGASATGVRELFASWIWYVVRRA